MQQDPAISVIIPTHNRCASLRRLLDALGAQTCSLQEVEVVVVADGCTDDTGRMLHGYSNAPFALRVIEQPAQGPAAARNHGAAEARGRWLLFLDDDIEPHPSLIDVHMRHHSQPGRVVIGYLPTVLQGQVGFFRAELRAWWEAMFQPMRQPGHRYRYSDLLTGNLSIEAEWFRRLGGLDPTLGCHEDYEFGLRLIEAGASLVFAPDAIGYHHEATDLNRSLQRKHQEGQADVRIGCIHPEMRTALPLAGFGETHALTERVLRHLSFAWPAGGDLLAAGLRRLLDLLERMRLRGRWRRLLVHLLDYWYWRGVSSAVGSRRALEDYLRAGRAAAGADSAEVESDLRAGMIVAEQSLDVQRPAGVGLGYGRRSVGHIPAQPGAERLRGVHLRPLLARDLAWPLLRALAWEQATGTVPPCERWPTPGPVQLEQGGHAESDVAFRVLELELSVPGAMRAIAGYAGLTILVRYHRRPVGWVTLSDLRGMAVLPEQMLEATYSQLGWELVPLALGEPYFREPPHGHPSCPVSVIVCTRNRTDDLRGCLQSLLAMDYPDDEIIVVDNAPSSDDTARLVAGLPVRYVREEQPGLDRARNRGIAEARHGIVAFIDDDARADPYWLRAIADVFAEPGVMAVTGLVAPAELDTRAQRLFERHYGGMGHGFRRRFIRRGGLSERELLWASGLGVGTNMAFRRDVFAAIGPFDIALDVGTSSRGGGDVEMFHRLVACGHTLVYEPAALVWHRHRRDLAALRQQVHNNGRSFGAYLLTCAQQRTMSRFAILSFAVGEWLVKWLLRRLLRPAGFPRRLVMAELAGALISPWAYARARWHARHPGAREAARTKEESIGS